MTIAEIRDLRDRIYEAPTLTMDAKRKLFRLVDETIRLRQGLWDCARISGADIEDDTPDSLVYPDIVDYAKQEVQQLRDDYDESLAECRVHD